MNSAQVKVAESDVEEATKAIVGIVARLTDEINQLRKQIAGPRILSVKKGDTWEYVPNRGIVKESRRFCVVKSVNKKKNHVQFIDGWNPLDDMLSDPGWVLLGRVFRGKKK